jgi:hypothetical protein
MIPDEVDSDIIDIWSRIDADNKPQAVRILRALTGTND